MVVVAPMVTLELEKALWPVVHDYLAVERKREPSMA